MHHCMGTFGPCVGMFVGAEVPVNSELEAGNPMKLM